MVPDSVYIEWRKRTSGAFRKFSSVYGKESGEKFILRDFEKHRRLIKSIARETEVVATRNLKTELFFLDLLISSFAALSIHMDSKNHKSSSFLEELRHPHNKGPDIEIYFMCAFIQIVNYSVSIRNLVSNGMDNQARSLLRIIIELMQQSLVLFDDTELFEEYAKAQNENEANDIWYENFGGGKLSKKIKKLEKDHFGSDYSLEMGKYHKETFRFLSQTNHHSFVATVVGTFQTDIETGKIYPILLGHISDASYTTLEILIFNLWYFQQFFQSICKKNYNFHLDDRMQDGEYFEAFSLYNVSRVLVYHYLMDSELSGKGGTEVL